MKSTKRDLPVATEPQDAEPVAWAIFTDNGNIRLWSTKPIEHPAAQPLYTHPPCAQANPSDAEIEEIAQANGIQKSDEHWGPRYYTDLGADLFRFARAVLARYGSAQADADKRQKWIPVSERLPEPFDDAEAPSEYLVASEPAGWVGMDVWCRQSDDTFNWDACDPGDITHWMPRPKPPKEGGAA